MSPIVQLLTEKNEHLERFYRLNEAELENFAAGNFDNVEGFYQTREGILDILKKLDDMMERAHERVPNSAVTDAEKKAVIEALNYKNDLVMRILEQDLQVLSAIESAKSEIIREISQVRSARKAIGSYHSGAANKRLDEEA